MSCFRRQLVLPTLVGLILLSASAQAQVSSNHIASVIIYPYVVVDPAAGIDTRIHLSNTTSQELRVSCFLEQNSRRCSVTAAQRCTTQADCPNGELCTDVWSVAPFAFRLTDRQPIGWNAGSGLTSLPLPFNEGSIPAVADPPFVGALRCLVVDEFGSPIAVNGLLGSAAIETRTEAGGFDVASYDALAVQADPDAAVLDGILVLAPDGTHAPARNIEILHLMSDGVLDPIQATTSTATDLIVLPLSVDYSAASPAQTVLQIAVLNEYETRLTTSISITGQLTRPISRIDTNDPTRSIFSAAVNGTTTTQLRLTSPGPSGIIALALERWINGEDPTQSSSVMRASTGVGIRPTADHIVVALSPRPTDTPTETPTETCTPTPTATPTLSHTATRTGTATPTQTSTQTRTSTVTASHTPAVTPSPSASHTPLASATPTRTTTPTFTATATSSVTSSSTATSSPTTTPSYTQTATDTPTSTPTSSPTTTPTDTPTSTPSLTQSPTHTPTGVPCACDCNDDGRVSGGELGTAVARALGRSGVTPCTTADANGDALTTIEDLVLCLHPAPLCTDASTGTGE